MEPPAGPVQNRRSSANTIDTADADRNRRAFVTDMIARNSDAFATEVDVQNMMHMFPGRL